MLERWKDCRVEDGKDGRLEYWIVGWLEVWNQLAPSQQSSPLPPFQPVFPFFRLFLPQSRITVTRKSDLGFRSQLSRKLTKLIMSDAPTAVQKPVTWKSGSSQLTTFNMPALITNVKSPSDKTLNGNVRRRISGRRYAFTSASRIAPPHDRLPRVELDAVKQPVHNDERQHVNC